MKFKIDKIAVRRSNVIIPLGSRLTFPLPIHYETQFNLNTTEREKERDIDSEKE